MTSNTTPPAKKEDKDVKLEDMPDFYERLEEIVDKFRPFYE